MTTAAAITPDDTAADSASNVTFTFEGQPIEANAGQSIAAALYAAGLRIFGRSFKYHRPRGLFCCSGECPNCLMQVDGRPNVRTCVEPARNGQQVARQNAWPSADFDFLNIFDRLHRMLPVGFYYKSFHKPRWVWPIFEHSVRHIAGLGKIDVSHSPESDCQVEHRHVDVCVVGAGPAGMSAAITAAASECSILVIERSTSPGGDLLHDPATVQSLTQHFRSLQKPNMELLTRTTAFGLYQANLIGAFSGDTLYKIRARHIIICTGGRERPVVFDNNDLPGIMLGTGAVRLARSVGRIARRAVIVTDGARGHHVARELSSAGIEIAAIVDRRAGAAGIESPFHVVYSSVVSAAVGRNRVKAVRIARVLPDGSLDAEQKIRCDLLCLAGSLAPANELLCQAGMRYSLEGGCWLGQSAVAGVLAAGAAAGSMNLHDQILEGQLRAAIATSELGFDSPTRIELERIWSQRQNANVEPASPCGSIIPPPPGGSRSKRFICLCEDVTQKDIEQAIDEGFDNIETLKRYTTANMGPCQGKMCGNLAVEVCSNATGRSFGSVGCTTSRPPSVPVDLCVLAAAAHHPERRTPLHHWHAAAAARWLDAGQWKRPEVYTLPASEVSAVRNRAGLIDVSTLGKIEVAGPDATKLLERTYINKWSDLKVGRARYGVMCNEDGIIFDDGVCARVDRDRFYLTATTGNADAVFQWLELWRDTWGLDVAIHNHTSSMAAMNLAGPLARGILSRLTKLDLTNKSFPYMAFRQGIVANVPCKLLRIGFVGELGYEIHCSTGQAWSLWESIFDAGRAVNLVPFGVEAQRILRLEKGHFIIGADTDALSNPLEAGLASMVRFDKGEFIGRPPLLRLRDRGPRAKLVGFTIPDRLEPPLEGSQVVVGHMPAGRVTSARFSPTLNASIGLAWVPHELSKPGSRFSIRWNRSDVDAIVIELPFFDPLGTRLRM